MMTLTARDAAPLLLDLVARIRLARPLVITILTSLVEFFLRFRHGAGGRCSSCGGFAPGH